MKPGTCHVAMTMETTMIILTMIENVDELMTLDITVVIGWQSY